MTQRRRKRQSLGDMDRLAEDGVAQRGVQRVRGGQIDRRMKEPAQGVAQLDELEQAGFGTRDELDEQIDVAVGARLASHQGTEDGQ